MEKAFDEAGEDGSDHAEGEHVEGDGEEDEGGGGAAAGGGCGVRGRSAVMSGETSSGSVIIGSGATGSGVVIGCGEFCGDSAMRLMAVYVSFVAPSWIFRRYCVACENLLRGDRV
ncbi:hypothetical protein [Tunturiibacter gelidiferens]|uniref:hypothetical protein n=1 Tax=Tunturiibacter gelidiferens TaxID=3069689 RepID=UPI003D9B8348